MGNLIDAMVDIDNSYVSAGQRPRTSPPKRVASASSTRAWAAVDLFVLERPIRRPIPQRVGETLAPIGRLGAGVDVEQADVFEQRPGRFANGSLERSVRHIGSDEERHVAVGGREARRGGDAHERLAGLEQALEIELGHENGMLQVEVEAFRDRGMQLTEHAQLLTVCGDVGGSPGVQAGVAPGA